MSLVKSSGIVSLLTLVSRMLGFAREVMIASHFGAGGGADAFFVAFTIPNLGRRMFAEGAFSQAFMPVLAQTRSEGTPAEERDLIAVVSGTLGGVLAAITIIGCLGAPALVWAFASGFDAEPGKEALAAGLLRWTFPYLMFISLTSLVAGVLNSHGRFGLPAAAPILLNLCIIASAWIDSSSAYVLAYAVFAAGILQLLSQLPLMAKLKLLPRPRWAWGDPRVKRIASLMGTVMLGSSVSQLSLMLNTNFSTHFGDGAVSWMNYASRLMEFPLGIFTIALGTAIMPVLSAQHSTKVPAQFSATLDWALRALLALGLPAALGLVLLAGPLVATIYGRGHFTARDIQMTTFALWAYGLGFMGFSLQKILLPGFYARQETRLPVRYGLISLGAGIAVSLLLFAVYQVHPFIGAHAGLALSTSLTAWLNALLLLRRLRADTIYRPAAGWGLFGLRLGLANLALAAVLLLAGGDLQQWTLSGGTLRVLHLLEILGMAVVVYFAVLWLTGIRPRDFRSPTPPAQPA